MLEKKAKRKHMVNSNLLLPLNYRLPTWEMHKQKVTGINIFVMIMATIIIFIMFVAAINIFFMVVSTLNIFVMCVAAINIFLSAQPFPNL